MSYDLEEEEPLEPKSTSKSPEPMPRLWKSEPEPSEAESRSAKKSPRGGEAEPSKNSSVSKTSAAKGNAKAAKAKGPSPTDDKGEKKVLIEETPTFDTLRNAAPRAADHGRVGRGLRDARWMEHLSSFSLRSGWN